MEFKFRAGEGPSPYFPSSTTNGFFTTQALRAGYIGRDLGGMNGLPNQMIPACEALRREIEKERIREEIIAREILFRRELEEEVRRELAYERELALRRHADRFSLAGSSPSAAALHPEPRRLLLPPPLPAHEVRAIEELPNSGPQNSRIVERLQVSSPHGVGGREKTPIQIPEVGEGQVVFLGKSTTATLNLAGSKRKAAPGSIQLTSPKKDKKEWFCALCEVSTTGPERLDEHLKGKRHKYREEELKVNKSGRKNKAPSTQLPSPKKEKKEWVCELCQVRTTGPQGLEEHLQGKRHKAKVEGFGDDKFADKNKGSLTVMQKKAAKFKPVKNATATTDGQKKPQTPHSGEQQKVSTFRCEHCKLNCNSQRMLDFHMRGKKHLFCVKKLRKQGKIDTTVMNEKNEQTVANGSAEQGSSTEQGSGEVHNTKGMSADGASAATDAPTDGDKVALKSIPSNATRETSSKTGIKNEGCQ